MLRDLPLLPVYDSAEHDIVRNLISPLLEQGTDYLRGVGFFSSGWLRIAADGIVGLVENGGRGRLVVSPVMQAGDWEAMQAGDRAKRDARLKKILCANVRGLRQSLEEDVFDALAWLVADEVLEFRFAVPRPAFAQGNYHDKVAVFRDVAGDVVAIHGSFNDSAQGTLNGEAFSVMGLPRVTSPVGSRTS